MTLKEKIKKAYVVGSTIATVAAYSTLITLAGFTAKNIIEINPQKNLEYKLTKSDLKQMNHLDSLLSTPVDNFDNFELLKKLNGYEAIGLHLSFHAYAMTNIGLSDDSKKLHAATSIDKAILKFLDDDMQSSIMNKYEAKKIDHNYNVKGTPDVKDNLFYYANLNLMIGGYKMLTKDNKYDKIHKELSNEIARNIEENGGANLNSFPYLCWTADTTVALASLKVYDKVEGTDVSSKSIDLWENWVRENMLDSDGALYSEMNPVTKKPSSEAKGSNFAYSLLFVNMFDEEFSSELYKTFEEHYYKPILGVELAKEWKDGRNDMHVDSGPVLFGAGAVASAFAMGAAKAHNDEYHFSTLSLAAELTTMPVETLTKKEYLGNVSLGESVLLFCRTYKPWN